MWTVKPVTNVSKEYPINNFTDSVSPALTGLYAINQSGLIVRSAATTNSTGGSSATAGIYFVYFADGNRTAVKLLVIRK